MPAPMLSRLSPLPVILALAAIWLLTHRYFGIQHDGLFYAVQALAHANPIAFRHDLFFAFGSQDDYSLFTLPYAWLSQLVGLGAATLLLLAVAHLAWALAAYAIARQALGGVATWIGLALLFALPRDYGAQGVFHYAESFLTARSWAESLVLAGVAASLGGYRGLSVLAIGAGFICHPIMALPGVIFLLVLHLRPGVRLLSVLAFICSAAAAVVLPRMDAEWIGMVTLRAPFLLLDQWTWGEMLEPFTWIGILLAAGTTTVPAMQRVYLSLALTGATGFYLALLGTATHATLLIQAQPWRCLWLLKVIALIALTGLIAQRWQRSNVDRWLLAGLTAAAMTANTLGGPVALLLAGICHFQSRLGTAPKLPGWLPLAGGTALVAVLFESGLALLQQLAYLAERLQLSFDSAKYMPLGDLAALTDSPLALLLPIGLGILLLACPRYPKTSVLAAALGLIVSAAGWYRADDATQAVLYAKTPQRPFAELVARNETVYWQDNLLYAWFLLRQGNYASTLQSVGVAFSRETAMEARRRFERLDAFGSADSGLPGSKKAGHAATRADLVQLCEDRILDKVIVNHRIDEIDAPQWLDPLIAAPWFLYRCADFRHARAAALPPPPSLPPLSRSEPLHRLQSTPGPAPA